jgi:pyrroloquinoline quinone biosynthesis protein B
VPQWNCACAICRAARTGKIPARTQSCVALSADGERWFLVNASPDLRAQIESFPALQPRRGSVRGSAIEAVLLTNADLDHVLGLFLLREGGELAVHATDVVRETLAVGLRIDEVLRAFGGIRWSTMMEEDAPLLDRAGEPSGLVCRALPLPGGPPPYAANCARPSGHSIALQFTDANGARLLVAPDVAEITPALRHAVMESDAVLLDGTFWSEDELRAIRPGARAAREMGHLPIDGAGGTLELMRASPARLKAYVHLNNTNPILLPGSRERAAVEAAGVRVAEDGWELEL